MAENGRPSGLRPFILLLLLQYVVSTLSFTNDILQIYSHSGLSGIPAPNSCLSALAANITCYANLPAAVTQQTTWSWEALELICSDKCEESLQTYVEQVDSACGTSQEYNISGAVQAAASAGREMQWRQSATCLKDPSTGDYCNRVFQKAARSDDGSNLQCSHCTLDYLTTLANSQWGQELIEPSNVASRIEECSASAQFTITATPTSTSAPSASATSDVAVGNTRCNASDTDLTTYQVQGNETCIDISLNQNISTPLLKMTNSLDAGCKYIRADQTLCLPQQCAIYQVTANDTCTSILNTLDHEVTTAVFRSWNPAINVDCSNIASFVGEYLCISPPGSLSIPDSFPLAAATSAVPMPTNAVTTSNSKCGYWYTVQSGDGCPTIEKKFSISKEDFYFLNPQLNNTCTALWLHNSYCVKPVGNIHTYSGYSTSTRGYTTLASSMNLKAKPTANRTTIHFFYSYPPMVTETATYNTKAYLETRNYTLCSDAMAYYNVTDSDQLMEYLSDDSEWLAEYQRVCELDVSSPLPTVPFNTSIPAMTITSTEGDSTPVITPSRTSTTTATSTTQATTASATSSISLMVSMGQKIMTGYAADQSSGTAAATTDTAVPVPTIARQPTVIALMEPATDLGSIKWNIIHSCQQRMLKVSHNGLLTWNHRWYPLPLLSVAFWRLDYTLPPLAGVMEVEAETVFNYLGKRYENAYLNNPNLCDIVSRALSALEPKSRVLDVGCGTGKPVAEMVVSSGYEVYGIDVAEEMVGIARSQVNGTFQKADMRRYTPPHAMDAVFAVYSLYQISPSETYSMVFKFAEWLREGGLLVLGCSPSTSLGPGQGTYDAVWDFIRDVRKPWMTFKVRETFFSENGWLELLQKAGFTIESERSFQFSPNDSEHKVTETHFLVTAKKTTSSPLFGPYPLPDRHTVLPPLDGNIWASLQRQMVIEGEQAPLLHHLATSQSILDVGSGLGSFLEVLETPIQGTIRPLPVLSEALPFKDNEFDTIFSTFALDSVPNLQKSLSELARITDSSSPNASITIIQRAPDNEVMKLLNTICLPLSEGASPPNHQGYILHCAKMALSNEGFGRISLHRLRSQYTFSETDNICEIADMVAGCWYREDKNYAQMKKALEPHIQNLFTEHPNTLRNDLVVFVARPEQN